ncbi:MAG: DUF6152 family protein [Pseudomonadales bacterium]|nr:DUF6152 family protein [Pseudomonadales bacterium]
MQKQPVQHAVVALLVAVSFFASFSYAHHSRSAFNLDETITIDGTVTEVGWTNPHYYLAVRDESSGQLQNWTFEGHSIPGLVRNGWRRSTLTVGSRVSLVAHPNSDPKVRFALLNHVTRSDGKTFYSFRPTDEILQATKPPLLPSIDFSGTWRIIRSLRSNLVGGFEPPSDWPLTAGASEEVARFDVNDDPSLNCEARGVPRMLSWPYSQKWVNRGDDIFITLEHAIEQRTLFNENIAAIPKSDHDLGQSRIMSRSDNELVVETRGFLPKFWGLTRGLSSGADKVVIEKYELVENGYRLKLTLTLVDPMSLTGTVTDTLHYAKVRDFDFAKEPSCDVRAARRHLEFERG